jgi:hypothetical protein
MEATIIDCQWRNMLCRGRGEKNASSKVATSAYTLKSTKEVFNVLEAWQSQKHSICYDSCSSL